MVRSAAMILAALILPEIALAQQAQGSHTVVDGDTLWDLAQQYYQDPFDWRLIWDANRTDINNPNLILPGQVLVIPGTEPAAEVTGVLVESPSGPSGPLVVPDSRAMRTIFFQDSSFVRGGVVTAEGVEYVAVARDLVYAAPWLTAFEVDPPHTGVLEGAAGRNNRGGTVRSYELVMVAMERPARVGEQLQIFEIDYEIEDVARVAHRTGVITVSTVVDGGIIGVVTSEFGRIRPGQFVGPAPEYDLSVGEYADPVSGGAAAMVMGFANGAGILGVGHVAFLDLGTNDGITLGDEFTLYNTADTEAVEGVLQVVGLAAETSTARVLRIRDAVFEQGVVVRLTKKMR